ncbi:hypothetical protein GA0115252_13741, partial [Streptomyces sp. DfronAA-171]
MARLLPLPVAGRASPQGHDDARAPPPAGPPR